MFKISKTTLEKEFPVLAVIFDMVQNTDDGSIGETGKQEFRKFVSRYNLKTYAQNHNETVYCFMVDRDIITVRKTSVAVNPFMTEEQRSLFDTNADVEEATNAGIEAAIEHAHSEWKTAVLDGISWLAKRMPEFTSDHVHQYMQKHHPDLKTHDTRAIGGVMRMAKNERWIEPTGRVEKSRRKEAHANPKAVWKSLLFTGQPEEAARTL